MSDRTRSIIIVVIVAGLVAAPATAALITGFEPVTGDIPISASDGPTVIVTGASDIQLTEFTPDDNTVDVQTDVGNITLSSQGNASVRLDDYDNGTFTNVTQLDVASNDLTISPSDKGSVVIGGDATALSFSDPTMDDGTPDVVYSATGQATLTVTQLPASTTVAAATTGGTALGSTTTDGNGNGTFSLVAGTDNEVVFFTNAAPTVDNASVSPAANSKLTADTQEYNIDVSDATFATQQGDLVNASLYIDGTLRGSDLLNANGTASVTESGLDGGDHTFHWEVEDKFGATGRSADIPFKTPEQLSIRDVDEPNDLFTGNVTVTARIFRSDNDTVIVRETTTGTVNLTNVPIDDNYIVSTNATGYFNRRALFDSLFEQQDVYMLDENTSASAVIFNVEDRTGQFGADSRIKISRPLNTTQSGPGEEEYVIVAGDRIGAASQFETVLENNVRYRVSIQSADGDTRDLGALSVGGPRSINLVVSGIDQGVEVPPDGVGIATNQTVTGSGASAEKTVEFTFIDESDETTDLSLVVHQAGNASNVFATAGPSPAAFPLGTYKFTQTFSGEAANVTLVANVTYERSGVTERQTLAFGVDRFPLGLPLGEGWATIFGVGFLIVIGGIFSTANARIGALVIPGVALALNVTGILDGVVTIASVGLAFGFAVGINLIQNQGGI
jgi:hypothetical protein